MLLLFRGRRALALGALDISARVRRARVAQLPQLAQRRRAAVAALRAGGAARGRSALNAAGVALFGCTPLPLAV